MKNKITITEIERKHILSMYGILHEDDRTPLDRLMECKFTSDGKYVVYQGKSYSCETGEEVPLNEEEWTLSDILHTGADILSAGMDFVIPGSGAVVDTLNALSYVIEAQFKSAEEKDSLYLMAAITFAFVILPGPLQAISIPLKRAVKTGVGLTSRVVVKGLKIIGGAIDTLLLGIPSKINAALKSPLAKNILGKWGDKISGFIGNFTSRIKPLLNKVTGKTGKETTEKITKTSLTNFFRVMPKISKGSFVLRKLGFVVGKPYKYVGRSGKAMTATIKEITDNGVKVAFKNGTTTSIPVETFIKNAVGAPWMRRGYSVMVPLFIKRFSEFILPDGNIDYTKIEQLPDLDPDITSQESTDMDIPTEDVPKKFTWVTSPTIEEAKNGKYIKYGMSGDSVSELQTKLNNVGNYGLVVDKKFGTKTKNALIDFQKKNNITPAKGIFGPKTWRVLFGTAPEIEILKSKKINNIPTVSTTVPTLNIPNVNDSDT